MYALQISSFGEPSDVVELVKLPDPHDPLANEVLVRRGIRTDQRL